MSRDPDDGDDRFEIDFSQAFPRAHRNRRLAKPVATKPSQQRAKRKFIADNFPLRNSPREMQRDLADLRPRATMKRVIEEMVATDLNRSSKSIAAELDDLGYEAAPQTVATIRREMIATLELCRRYGSITVPAWED